MYVSKEIRDRVQAKIEQCLAIANSTFKPMFPFKYPTVTYNVRGTTGGIAYCERWEVSFNSVLLIENVDKFINTTVPHEVAHLIDHARNGDRSHGYKRSVHGYTWKAIMQVFGVDPDRCHTYDTVNAQVKIKNKFIYTCGCNKDHVVSSVRHNKMVRSGARYSCKRCGTAIVYKQALGQVTVRRALEYVAQQKAKNV